MRRSDVEQLDPTRTWWVPAVVSPERDWAAAPGCRRGARFMVDGRTFRPSRGEFEAFDSQLACLRWIMRHRARLNRGLGGVAIRAVPLDRWLLGLD
ncbi:MAG: hypothetical protein JOZ90_07190 [Alphaproteobacteria bacterium]|nr:hypothetical protein [Alphaproteobacteria bacterium]MBV9371672.1 hypothetical protein [Alphaproteobacteria bacterium]MBV9900868.1 hypothetical protein [Alphaproteobacteria bacterium]